MAGDMKRAYMRSVLLLAMAVLAGCGPGEELRAEDAADQTNEGVTP